jgi:serine protease Do
MPIQSSKEFRSMLLGAGAATALAIGGFATAPALFQHAFAKEIVIAPPTGAPMSFADLIEKVSPAVVSITVKQKPGVDDEDDDDSPNDLPKDFEDFLKKLPQQPQRPRGETTALGSGFFVNDKGLIVTNHHVIEGATDITITTSASKKYAAHIVGSDELTDLAVLQIDKPDQAFSFVTFDRDADLRVGDWVVAVGNPFGLEGTATAGIVSAKGRKEVSATSSYVDFLQIDAPINRGNSGGPTFDLRGRVVGVNSAIFSPTGGSVGIGFAIPSETAAAVVDSLTKNGKVTRGWLGVSIQPVDEDMAKSLGLPVAHGAMVAQLVPGGPAEKSGLRQGDVVLKVDGNEVLDSRDLTRRIGSFQVGKSANLEILRDGQKRMLTVKLAERPGEKQLAAYSPDKDPQTGDAPKSNGVTKQALLGVDVRPVTAADRTRLKLTSDETGVIIDAVDADSPLGKKGVAPGVAIIAAGGQRVRTAADLTAAVNAAASAKRPVLLQLATPGGRAFVAADLKGTVK